jgi:hypothetical protein
MSDGEPVATEIEITSLEELIDNLELVDVKFYEINATRRDQGIDNLEDELTPVHALRIGFGDRGLEIRLRVEVPAKFGDIRADAATIYQTRSEDIHLVIPPEVALDFANRVGIMAVLPFLREAVMSISQKVLDDAVLMPIIRAGELVFTEQSTS